MAAGCVAAQSAGSWVVRAGATTIKPQGPSENLTAPALWIPGTTTGSQTNTGSDTQMGGGITYMLTDNVSVDLPLSLPFKHKLYGAGAIEGVGQIGAVKALPVTLFLQYRFMDARSTVRPYVGLGATYAYFYGAEGSGTLTRLTGGTPANPTTLSIDSKFILTPQIGVTVAVNDRWSLDLTYSKSSLKTQSKLSTGQTVDAALDPSSTSIAVSYRY
jgi:outer membrane protein